jgi:VanZ family protein
MARHRSSAGPLAWLYAALIVYASLSPFTGWKQPIALPLAGLGHLPWQRYWTAFDVVSNLLGYMPLGALAVGALVRSGRRVSIAFIVALLAGAALSFLMESLQNWLPQRVPSVLDWMLNAAGTLAGALVAVAVHALGGIERWQTLRDRWFVDRSAGGLLLLLLWPIGLLFPTPVPLGLGQVLVRLQELAAEALAGTPWSAWTEDWSDASVAMTPLSRVSELLAILLGLLAPCLIAYTIVRPGWRRAVTVPGAAALGFATTTLSTALNFGPQHALAWLTPPALPGLLAGAIAGLLLLRIPRRGAAGLGLVIVTALVALVAQAPTDPYYAESLQGWEQGRFIRFHGLAQWIGWLWPYAALVYLLARVTARDNAERMAAGAQAGP